MLRLKHITEGTPDAPFLLLSWDDLAELLSPFAEVDRTGRVQHQRLVPQLRMPASSIPVIVTTSAEGQW